MTNADASGHHQRLRERFTNSDLSGLADYEILELLLTFVINRKDTKPIAKELIRQFKTVNRVLNADAADLQKIDGIGERTCAFFHLIREVGAYCLLEKASKQSVITRRTDVEEYLRFTFGNKQDEYVAMVYLDNGNHVLGADIVAEGTVNQCAAYPRAFFEKALKNRATSFIIAHNHPGGSLHASQADWELTERLHKIGKLLDIPLLDHIIICQDSVVTLREDGRWPG